MKIYRLALQVFCASLALGLTPSCKETKKEKEPPVEEVESFSGFYIINQGNAASKIPGTVTAFNYSDNASTPALEDAFLDANGVAMGDAAMSGLVYGNKMFINVYESDIIWVVDPTTLKITGNIKPDATLQGHNPRHMTVYDGKLYVSMYTGYVTCINPADLTIEKEIKVGPNPEGLAGADGKIYVANSDGMNWLGNYADASLSIIDVATWTETKFADLSKIFNPTSVQTDGKDFFVLCMGDYSAIPASVKKVSGTTVTDFAAGNYMDMAAGQVYVINAPYGLYTAPSCTKYDAKTGQKTGEFAVPVADTDSWLSSVTGFGVDPVTEETVIYSNHIAASGWADYYNPGYANIYDKTGTFKRRIDTGVGPVSVTFVHQNK